MTRTPFPARTRSIVTALAAAGAACLSGCGTGVAPSTTGHSRYQGDAVWNVSQADGGPVSRARPEPARRGA